MPKQFVGTTIYLASAAFAFAFFGAARKAQPTGGEAVIWATAALLAATCPLHGIDLSEAACRPDQYIPRTFTSSAGYDGIRATVEPFLREPHSHFGSLATGRARERKVPKLSEVFGHLSSAARATYDLVLTGARVHLPPCLSAGRAALRSVEGTLKSGGRLV